MDFDKDYPEDRDRRINGVRRPIGDDGAYVVVAAWMNPVHAHEINRLARVHLSENRPGERSADEMDRKDCEAMAVGILKGWGGITAKGEAIEYSREAAIEMLFRRLGFRNRVIALAQEEAAGRTAEESSAGKS